MKFPLVVLSILVLRIHGFCQTSIDTAYTISIGGINQYITIKGRDTANPVLLFLHGGPGSSAMSYDDKFTYHLQQQFNVVQWDQRETGKTLGYNRSQYPLTLKLFESDTKELIDTLLKKFNDSKLYLMGHSWGTFPGFSMAIHHPEVLYAYIPVCPMVNQHESERIILSLMKEKAIRSKNEKALAELNTVKVPFENGTQLFFHRKWLLDFNASKKDLKKTYVEEWASRWLNLFNEASRNNLMEKAPVLQCPIYFMVGRKDYQTNSKLTSAYYETLTAPKKSIFWFENSGHFIPSTEPNLLQEIIIQKILPETLITPGNSTVQTTN